METLIVFRERRSAYSQVTTFKDSEGRVMMIFGHMLKQPRKNKQTITIRNILYKLDWRNVK